MRKLSHLLIIPLVAIIFFYQFFVNGLLPIPADTIIGLYHPFRDLYAKDYPRGIPYKNSLITDPVRQQYPWRWLVIEVERRQILPLWNPYNLAGTPLLANFQSGSFYPLNILFMYLPFHTAWSYLIFLEPLLVGIFSYLYLSNLRLSKPARLLGAITFSFCGFSVSWLEWGTVIHTALWLPLILLSIDKMVLSTKSKNLFLWSLTYIFSLIFSFFAGHLQTFFYLSTFSLVYFSTRWFQFDKSGRILSIYLILNVVFAVLTSIQWIPTLQLISLSARNIDLDWHFHGWFIPWEHLIQFAAPDFFGNPVTLNYFGVWNWAEFVGYVGILPLILAFFALFFRRDKKTLFFGIAFFLSLIFALPTFFAKLPFILQIPLVDTSQPTRLLFITDFSLAVLAALGFDRFIKSAKGIFYPVGFVGLIFAMLWGFVSFGSDYLSVEHLSVAKQNLIFPTAMFVASIGVISFYLLSRRFLKRKDLKEVAAYLFVVVVAFDLLRFGLKFNPFTKQEYLFPSTSSIKYLQKNIGHHRFMTSDSRILAPNFAVAYKLQSIDGYDPLYLMRYGELIAASERGNANISPPFGFNRIINPHNYSSAFTDLLGVKYVLSLSDINTHNHIKVFQEGETKIYENKRVLPRTFFVRNVTSVKTKEEAMAALYDLRDSLDEIAVVEGIDRNPVEFNVGTAEIIKYEENRINIETKNDGDGFLVLTDSFYPTWKAEIDGKEVEIYLTDFNFRGIVVPSGIHKIEFYNNLF